MARAMLVFPVAGKPVRQTAGGLGYEECPMTERRAENCASRHGYVVLSRSRVVSIWMVIDDDVQARADSKIVQRLRLGFHCGRELDTDYGC
jgi:hypothetical protein